MPLVRLSDGETGTARRGDAVFDTRAREPRFPVHVGIHVGLSDQAVGPGAELDVLGIPAGPSEPDNGRSGVRVWGSPGAYVADILGQRTEDEVDPYQLGEAANIAMRLHQDVAGGIPWVSAKKRIIGRDIGAAGFQPFLQGTCSQFVNYVYECAGLALVDEAHTCGERPLRPMLLLRSFHLGSHPLAATWDPRMDEWPGCLAF